MAGVDPVVTVVTLPPFQALLDEHAADLHRFVVAQVGPHDGADCFQEAVVSALRAYPDLRDATNLRGWLFTIAHRKVLDLYRGNGRRPEPVDQPPERPVEDRDRTADDELWAAVRRLPPKQRAAVALRYLGDRPYAEIAAALDCSEAAARQNVRAGLATLRREVQP